KKKKKSETIKSENYQEITMHLNLWHIKYCTSNFTNTSYYISSDQFNNNTLTNDVIINNSVNQTFYSCHFQSFQNKSVVILLIISMGCIGSTHPWFDRWNDREVEKRKWTTKLIACSITLLCACVLNWSSFVFESIISNDNEYYTKQDTRVMTVKSRNNLHTGMLAINASMLLGFVLSLFIFFFVLKPHIFVIHICVYIYIYTYMYYKYVSFVTVGYWIGIVLAVVHCGSPTRYGAMERRRSRRNERRSMVQMQEHNDSDLLDVDHVLNLAEIGADIGVVDVDAEESNLQQSFPNDNDHRHSNYESRNTHSLHSTESEEKHEHDQKDGGDHIVHRRQLHQDPLLQQREEKDQVSDHYNSHSSNADEDFKTQEKTDYQRFSDMNDHELYEKSSDENSGIGHNLLTKISTVNKPLKWLNKKNHTDENRHSLLMDNNTTDKCNNTSNKSDNDFDTT
ncbi:hypothetical protein RFI_09136, partial [Reticulomyxa filosa]